jgi:hypothetical protein
LTPSETPTPSATPTPSETPMPTTTPTPRTRLMLGGYMSTRITEADGGFLVLVVMAETPGGALPEALDLTYLEADTFFRLRDDGLSGDFAAGDGWYGLAARFAPGLPQGAWLYAVSLDGSNPDAPAWPYLHVTP